MKADSAERGLAAKSDLIASLNSNSVSWQSIRDDLQEDEAAIEFVVFRDYVDGVITDEGSIYALIVRSNSKSPKAVPVCKASELDSLMRRDAGEDDLVVAANLYRADGGIDKLLWDLLAPHLDGASTVFICPSGPLHQVNFSAIPLGESSNVLSKMSVRTVLNSADIKRARSASAMNDALLVGGIDYENAESTGDAESANYTPEVVPTGASSINFSPLPGTKFEVEKVSEILGSADFSSSTFSGTKASEANFKKKLRGSAPSIVHIATHGFFFERIEEPSSGKSVTEKILNAKNPLMRSGLLLAGGNASWKGRRDDFDKEDGILSSLEISNADLGGTELVVLSACQTGLGDVAGSEGVYGLQRAFRLAGANKLLLSLWKVPDNYTAKLMELFYKNLVKGKTASESLRQAQLTMSRITGPENWAAFVLIE